MSIYEKEKVFLVSPKPLEGKYLSSQKNEYDNDSLEFDKDFFENSYYTSSLQEAKQIMDSDNLEKVYIYRASSEHNDEIQGYDYDEEEGGEYVFKDPAYTTYKLLEQKVEVTKQKDGISIKELGGANTKEWVSEELEKDIKKLIYDEEYLLAKDSNGTVDMANVETYMKFNITNFIDDNFKKEHQKESLKELEDIGMLDGIDYEYQKKDKDFTYPNLIKKFSDSINKGDKRLKGFTVAGIDSPARKQANNAIFELKRNIDSNIREYNELKEEHELGLSITEKKVDEIRLKQENLVTKTFISNDDLKDYKSIEKSLCLPDQKQELKKNLEQELKFKTPIKKKSLKL